MTISGTFRQSVIWIVFLCKNDSSFILFSHKYYFDKLYRFAYKSIVQSTEFIGMCRMESEWYKIHK